MKVAVVEFAGRGGLAQYAFQLCRALAAAGAEVTLVTSTRYELAALPHNFAVEAILRLWDPKPATGVVPRGPRRLLRRAGRAVRHYREWARVIAFLARTRPDVVQLGDVRFPSDLACLLLLRLLGLRLADVCHNVHPFAGGTGGGMPRRSLLSRVAFTAVYRCFHVVFVHFEANRRALREAYRLPADRLAVIPHGHEAVFEELRDPGRTAASLRAELDLPAEAPVALLLGTLTAYKGVDSLLRAFASVHAALPVARLVVAGHPAPDLDLDGLHATARALGIHEAVRIVPRYIEAPEVAAWLEMARVAVCPYRTVFQSGAVMLAQTLGVPVVATRVGAMAEQIQEGSTGLLVAPGDEAALAAALLRVLGDEDLARDLGRHGRAHALGACAWDRVAAAVLARYRDLVAGSPARAGAAPEKARP